MHKRDLSRWQHRHDFTGEFSAAERNMRRVLVLTSGMMVVEIFGGWRFHSMALLADGWHMATHVTAFFIAAGAYWMARHHAQDSRFSFGTGKIGVLGGWTSAVMLGGAALYMAGESLARIFHPQSIGFDTAIPIACVGLLVNVVSALLLGRSHAHDHSHAQDHHGHADHHNDLNLRSAYLHVLADAVTSVLAITALVCGKLFGWFWLDPVMGFVGSLVIAQWSVSLLRETHIILLDREPEASNLNQEIRKTIESDGDARIVDLHIWQVGVKKFSAIVSLVADAPKPPETYKQLLRAHEELVHLTVEVNPCQPAAVGIAA